MAGCSTASRYTSARFSKSWSFVLATGYIVLSGKVMAFRNVCIELFSRSTNGSLTGNLSEPHSTECSRMWNTPVSSAGGVLNAMENALLLSPFRRYSSCAPLLSWSSTYAVPSISGSSSRVRTVNPCSFCSGARSMQCRLSG